jgi:hypothetical protein
MTRTRTYGTLPRQATAQPPAPASGEHPPPTWPDAPAASIETINAIAHELAHES